MTPSAPIRRSLRFAYRVAGLAILVSGAALASARLDPESVLGPEPSYSGAPATGAKPAEFNCTLCHFANEMGENLNTPGGSIELLGLPSLYQPNASYSIQVRLRSDSTIAFPERRWGFQLTAIREQDGEGCGTFSVPAPDSLQIIPGYAPFESRRYVEHRDVGTHPGESGPIVWSFSWQAPASLEGPVLFCAAGNAANGSFEPSGDFIHTSVVRVVGATAGVEPPQAALTLDPAWPNPASGRTHLRYALPVAMKVRLEIYDIRGRRVRTLVRDAVEQGAHAVVWRGEGERGVAMGPGIYWARLTTPIGVRQARIVRH